MTTQPAHSQTQEKIRIESLEKQARSKLFELSLLASLGELQHGAHVSGGEPEDILVFAENHLKRLMDFKAMAFFLVDGEENEFVPTRMDPADEKERLQKEIDEQIDSGEFAWAVSQNRPVVVSSRLYDGPIILHALATPSGVRGLFAGVPASGKKKIIEPSLYPLSILLQGTANALENLALHKTLSVQNQNLEELVRKRTQVLEDQTRELKEEIAYRSLAEESLVVAKEEADAAVHLKNEFVANITHEFRTPLNAILGYGEILKYEAEKLKREDLIKDIKSIERSGKHLLRLVNDTLDLSKIQAGKMALRLETFKVFETVEDVIATVRPIAQKNGNRLSVTYQGFVKSMHSDGFRVRQILLNVLSNACKFTKNGSIVLTVSGKRQEGEEWIYFTVEDTGVGIEADGIEDVFKEFGQTDAKRKQEGTGLGMAISKRLCKMMGGDIVASSEPGKGSIFTVGLPLDLSQSGAFAEKLPDEAAGENPAEEGSEISNEPDSVPRPAKSQPDAECPSDLVLVVDDDAIVRDLIKRFLERQGYRVETAKDGEDGLQKAKALRPKIITLDIMMPEMDGWTVLSKLKEDAAVSSIPVVIVSIVEQREKAFEMGAADYLTKPLDWDRFLSVLRKYWDIHPASPILVVEDDVPNRGALCRVLTRDGWRTVEAEDGIDAIKVLEKEIPSLILLDLVLPTMDGFDFISRLRKNGRWQSIPIIVLTAKELSQKEKGLLQGEVERVFHKGDYTRSQLLEEIRHLTASS